MSDSVFQLPASLRRVLILRMSALGDIVNALYVLPALRAALPDARIGWVVDDRFSGLFDCVPDVHEVIVFPRARWGRALRNPLRWPVVAWQARTYLNDLRGRGYEAALDFQGNAKSAFHLWGAGIPLRVGFDASGAREGAHGFANVRVPASAGRVPRAEKFLSLLRVLGVRVDTPSVRFRVPAVEEAEVGRFLETHGLSDRRFAVLHPGSSAFGSYKRWPPERFAALARRLAADGLGVVVSWGPSEKELSESIVRVGGAAEVGAGGMRIVLALETRPIARLVALLQRASVFVGNDSGPLHLAAACGTPVVGLYGPKDPAVYGPFSGPRAVLYHPLPCSPCGRRRCGFNECMELIPVEDVRDRVHLLLRERGSLVDAMRTVHEGVRIFLHGNEPLAFHGAPLRGRGAGRLTVDAPPPRRGTLRRFRVGSWAWESVPEIAGPLAAAAMRSPEGLPGLPVSEQGRRRFLRATLPHLRTGPDEHPLDVFVKAYPVRGIAPSLRALAGTSQAEVEFERLRRLHGAGAPVPKPLALGRGPGWRALVLEDLGTVLTVGDHLGGWLKSADRPLHHPIRALRATAAAAAALHAAGFVHWDFHVGNVLQLSDGAVRVVDVHRGRDADPVTLRDRAMSLAQLLFSLSPYVGVSVRARVLKAYAAEAKLNRADARALARGVDREFARIRERYGKGQESRARRGGSRLWVGPWEGGVARATREARPYLHAPEMVEAVIKDEAGRRVLRVRKGPLHLAVKEDRHRRRSLREWVGAHAMRARHLPSPRPAFLVVPRRGPSRLATEWLDGAAPVNEYVGERLRASGGSAWRREAAWRLGRFVRRIHSAGVYHADLKAGNVLARDDVEGRPEFFALDLDRIRTYAGQVPRRRALENLAQLNAAMPHPVTCTDRLRCFFAYAARDVDLRRGWKAAVRDVMQRTVARHHRWP